AAFESKDVVVRRALVFAAEAPGDGQALLAFSSDRPPRQRATAFDPGTPRRRRPLARARIVGTRTGRRSLRRDTADTPEHTGVHHSRAPTSCNGLCHHDPARETTIHSTTFSAAHVSKAHSVNKDPPNRDISPLSLLAAPPFSRRANRSTPSSRASAANTSARR